MFRLAPVMTENIGQSFAESSFLGREKPTPVVPIAGLHACQDVPALNKLAHSAPHTPVEQGYMYDDCENSAMAAEICAESVKQHPWSDHEYVKSELRQCLSTRDMQDPCIRAGRLFFAKVQGMFTSGELDVNLMVCLASSAQAAGTAGEGPFESGLRALSAELRPGDLGAAANPRCGEPGTAANLRRRPGDPGTTAGRHILRDEYSFSDEDTDVQDDEAAIDPVRDLNYRDDDGASDQDPRDDDDVGADAPASAEDLFDSDGAFGCGHCCAVRAGVSGCLEIRLTCVGLPGVALEGSGKQRSARRDPRGDHGVQEGRGHAGHPAVQDALQLAGSRRRARVQDHHAGQDAEQPVPVPVQPEPDLHLRG